MTKALLRKSLVNRSQVDVTGGASLESLDHRQGERMHVLTPAGLKTTRLDHDALVIAQIKKVVGGLGINKRDKGDVLGGKVPDVVQDTAADRIAEILAGCVGTDVAEVDRAVALGGEGSIQQGTVATVMVAVHVVAVSVVEAVVIVDAIVVVVVVAMAKVGSTTQTSHATALLRKAIKVGVERQRHGRTVLRVGRTSKGERIGHAGGTVGGLFGASILAIVHAAARVARVLRQGSDGLHGVSDVGEVDKGNVLLPQDLDGINQSKLRKVGAQSLLRHRVIHATEKDVAGSALLDSLKNLRGDGRGFPPTHTELLTCEFELARGGVVMEGVCRSRVQKGDKGTRLFGQETGILDNAVTDQIQDVLDG